MDSSQNQTSVVFQSLWNEASTYENHDTRFEQSLYIDWSDNKILGWIDQIKSILTRHDLHLLDAGCGLGHSFINLWTLSPPKEKTEVDESYADGVSDHTLIYSGVDLILLDKTRAYIHSHLQARQATGKVEVILKQQKMTDFSASHPDHFDAVLALGSLHHTDSVQKSFTSTFRSLKSSKKGALRTGYYLGWIINEQKPLRKVTDKFFRDYFSRFKALEDCRLELETLIKIFSSLGEATRGKVVCLSHKSEVLGLEPGEYDLQSLLYDYFLKAYSRPAQSGNRHIHQLFDWFAPKYYHQTTREEVFDMFTALNQQGINLKILDIVTKTNGHFFFLQRQ